MKLFFENCSRNFLDSKELLYPDLRNFDLVFAILILVHITLISFENMYTCTLICSLYPVKEVHPKRKHRKRYKEENPRRFVFGKNKCCSFVCSRSCNYYTLYLVYFDLKSIHSYCVYWIVAEISVSNSFHIICNEFFISHYHDRKEGSFLCETVTSFSTWILVCLSWNLSRFVPHSVGIPP